MIRSAERRLRAEALVAVADGRREPLEQLRFRFIERLRRASDDFAATEGLRVVEAALATGPSTGGSLRLEPARAIADTVVETEAGPMSG